MPIMPNTQNLSKYFLKVMTLSCLLSSNFNEFNLVYLKKTGLEKEHVEFQNHTSLFSD